MLNINTCFQNLEESGDSAAESETHQYERQVQNLDSDSDRLQIYDSR